MTSEYFTAKPFPSEVTDFFLIVPNPSSYNMALGFTHSPTEMSAGDLPLG
jgi:hypothetical protein